MTGLAIFLVGDPARAQNISADYTFLVASGFLCNSAACPAAARSANDESYEMSGAGTFSTQSKSVTAAGTYAHKSPSGTVLESGVWIVTDLVSFDSYGVAPGALRQLGVTLGPQPIGPKGLPIPSGPIPTGGLAAFHIRLLPMWGASKPAVLQVNSALGDVPHERSVEGIRLTLERNNNEYSEEVGGRVMFLALRSKVISRSFCPGYPHGNDPPVVACKKASEVAAAVCGNSTQSEFRYEERFDDVCYFGLSSSFWVSEARYL
jgi:hypothetical protein